MNNPVEVGVTKNEAELSGLGDDEELAIGGKIAGLRDGPVVVQEV